LCRSHVTQNALALLTAWCQQAGVAIAKPRQCAARPLSEFTPMKPAARKAAKPISLTQFLIGSHHAAARD
jgi:hypothetical protein